MRNFLLILFTVGIIGYAEVSPYTVESKVTEDLQAVLSRIIDREQFLVQVTAQVDTRTRRRIIEGETIVESPPITSAPKPPDPLPGFVPDSAESAQEVVPAKKTRETFENVKTARLTKVQVAVSLDQDLPQQIIAHGKRVVTEYLFNRYPEKTQLNFYLIPMLKPKMRALASEAKTKLQFPPPEEATTDELASKWLPWALFLVVLAVLLWRTRTPRPTKRRTAAQAQAPAPQPMYPMAQFPQATPENAKSSVEETEEERLSRVRRTLLGTVLANAAAFRLYYESLPPDEQGELEAVLAGPAFDNLMATLVKERAAASANVDDPEELIQKHNNQFDEYVRSKQWQEQQLFGFLHALGDAQVMSMVNFESDLNVCLILRFLKPSQSAHVLDSLTPERRLQVLQKMNEIYGMPLSEIAKAEQQIRSVVQRLPSVTMGPGKQELAFWGDVLSESTQTPQILEDLEQTQSRIVDHLQKYKLTLEDAATLPDEFLNGILAETDNEELCLALTTCSDEVIQVILDNVSARRREVLVDQLPSYQNANRESAMKARNNLTKKIREGAA